MTVYELFHETNSGHGAESDGYVEAVYLTEPLAEAARLLAIRTAVANGKDVWWHPEQGEADGPVDWTDDWHVEAHDVRETVPAPQPLDVACPTCGRVPMLDCLDRRRTPLSRATPHVARTRLAATLAKGV